MGLDALSVQVFGVIASNLIKRFTRDNSHLLGRIFITNKIHLHASFSSDPEGRITKHFSRTMTSTCVPTLKPASSNQRPDRGSSALGLLQNDRTTLRLRVFFSIFGLNLISSPKSNFVNAEVQLQYHVVFWAKSHEPTKSELRKALTTAEI